MDRGESQSKISPIIHEFIDGSVGLHAYIVIDSLRDGTSCGGLRITDDVTLEEIKALAQAMTFKYCFLKRNTGGAKAGIIIPKNCTREQRTKILEAFGRNASVLLRKQTYIPWTDLNSCSDDIATIMNAAGCDFHGISDSSFFTALTVVSAVKAACEIKGIDISTVSVTIEGFGAVGENIATELIKYGVKIIGISTVKGALYDASGLDINKLKILKKQYNNDLIQHYSTEWIERKELLLEMNTDILVPCARTWCINKENMNNIKAKIIVPGANVALTKEAEEFLHHKGILCLPDFICNIGGIFGTSLYDNRNSISTVHRFIIDEFGQLVKELICASIRENSPTFEIARLVIEKNSFENFKETKNKSFLNKFSIKLLRIIIYFLRFFPRLQPWISLQRQRKIFIENIRSIQNYC